MSEKKARKLGKILSKKGEKAAQIHEQLVNQQLTQSARLINLIINPESDDAKATIKLIKEQYLEDKEGLDNFISQYISNE